MTRRNWHHLVVSSVVGCGLRNHSQCSENVKEKVKRRKRTKQLVSTMHINEEGEMGKAEDELLARETSYFLCSD